MMGFATQRQSSPTAQNTPDTPADTKLTAPLATPLVSGAL
jgi:hypothetical protein